MTVSIDGVSLSLEDVRKVVGGETVRLTEKTEKRIRDKHRTLVDYASDNPVYGLNRGVGAKRHLEVGDGSGDEDFQGSKSQVLNRELIHSSCVSIGDPCTVDETRAILVAKLNTLAMGYAGARLALVEKLVWMLNHNVLPVLPSEGSLGDADFTILAHVGLGLLGEGEFWVDEELKSSGFVVRETAFEPIELKAKDGLAVMSSNDFSNGLSALRVAEFREFVALSEVIGALSLEALNGNAEPLQEVTNDLTEKQGQRESAERLRAHLSGSFIMRREQAPSLQDPLSFRCMTQVFGAFRENLSHVENRLEDQLNSSEDNPAVVGESVLPTGNFQNLHWVLPFRGLLESICHLTRTAARRADHVLDPHYRDLEYGVPDEGRNFGFNSVPNTIHYLEEKVRSLANLQPPAFLPAARGIEDHASGGPQVLDRAENAVKYAKKLIGLEAAVAVRVLKHSEHSDPRNLGDRTSAIFRSISSRIEDLSDADGRETTIELNGNVLLGIVENVLSDVSLE